MPNTHTPVPAVELHKQLVRQLYETCINQGKSELLHELLAEGFVDGNGELSPTEFGNSIIRIRNAFPDVRFEVEDLIAEGERVVARWRFQATHLGAFLGVPPSGQRLTQVGIDIYQCRNGQISRAWTQLDRLGVLQQIGGVPGSETVTSLGPGKERRNGEAQLNHTFVWCRDKQKSATFLTEVLGLPAPIKLGSMPVVQLSNNVSLDFCESEGEISSQHYAFLISEDEFDRVLARFRKSGIPHWADPEKQRPGDIYLHNGGRGAYFDDPNGHFLEVMTQPYASDE